MSELIKSFIKIFYRNPRALFFVIFLPSILMLAIGIVGVEQILRFDLPFSYNAFLLTGVISFALMQTGIYTAAYTMVDYKRAKILKRFAVTPLDAGEFMFAQTLARYIIALLQIAALLILGIMFFDASVRMEWLALPVIILFGNSLFLQFSFLIAAVARNYEEAAPYTFMLGTPFIFLGDIFFPVANLPVIWQRIAELLPLKPLADVVRWSVLGSTSEHLMQSMLVLGVWLVILILLARFAFSRRVYV